MQLNVVNLGHNQLVATLPEAWGNLTNVGPVMLLLLVIIELNKVGCTECQHQQSSTLAMCQLIHVS